MYLAVATVSIATISLIATLDDVTVIDKVTVVEIDEKLTNINQNYGNGPLQKKSRMYITTRHTVGLIWTTYNCINWRSVNGEKIMNNIQSSFKT